MEIENPIFAAFVAAARDAISTMAMLEIDVEDCMSQADKIDGTLEYTTVVGLTGEQDGVLVLSLTEKLAKQVVGAMLGMEVDEFEGDEDVLDGIGELGNMVAGGAKTGLQDTEHSFDLALPTTIRGDKVVLQPKPGTPGLIINCSIGGESMYIGIWKHGVTDNVPD